MSTNASRPAGPAPHRPDGSVVLAFVSVGATVLTFDVTILRVHIPLAIVWISGIAAVLMIAIPALSWVAARPPGHRPVHDPHRLAANACRRAERSLRGFLADEGLPWSSDPTSPLGRRQRDKREREILARYYRQRYPWLVQVMDDAISAGGALQSTRDMLDVRNVEQLVGLPDIFREVANELLPGGER